GVQTCALPILCQSMSPLLAPATPKRQKIAPLPLRDRQKIADTSPRQSSAITPVDALAINRTGKIACRTSSPAAPVALSTKSRAAARPMPSAGRGPGDDPSRFRLPEIPHGLNQHVYTNTQRNS